jgi:GT2 family glycosyltransferase
MVVWLVISSYRNDSDILRILAQVHNCDQKFFSNILVVDSEGTGAIPAAISQNGWTDVVYRSYDYNLGSGANLSERLRIAAQEGADFAYALNHDGNFDPTVLAALLNHGASIDKLGAAYPLSFLTSREAYNITGTRELPLSARLIPTAPTQPLLDAFWSSSNGALYSMAPVRQGILPWPELWMAWEDLEYGWRLADRGFRQVIVTQALYRDNYEYRSSWLGHTVNKPAWRTYYNFRNLLLAIRRTRPRPLFYAVAAYRLILEIAMILLIRSHKFERLRFLLNGFHQGLTEQIDLSGDIVPAKSFKPSCAPQSAES